MKKAEEEVVEPPEPKKSIAELVLETKKDSTEIKEVIEESPPPADKVIAPKAAVQNLFKQFKRSNRLLTRKKKIIKAIKKQAAKA